MKNNKLLETILVFDGLERKRFRNVIKNKRRESLLALYEFCLARIEKNLPLPAKEEVYAHLFNEPYTKEKDFLLRNEFRLLTDEAEAFLRAIAVEAQYPALCEAARLKRIFESGNRSLFKKEFDAMAAKWGHDLWFWLGADPVFLDYFIATEQFTAEHFGEVKQKTGEANDRLNRLYNRLLSEYEVRSAYADKVHSILSDKEMEPFVSGTVPTRHEDPLVMYRMLKVKSYHHSGEEKIKVLLEAHDLISKTGLSEPGREEVWWLQASIGLEYHLRYDFQSAMRYLDELFRSPGIESFYRFTEMALNYMSTLIGCGEYHKAIRQISPFEEHMIGARPVFYKYICLKALNYLFLDNGSAARKELNRVEAHGSEVDFLYWRVVMILSFAVDGRWEDAQNEFRNLVKSKNMRENVRSDWDNLVYVTDGLLKVGTAHEAGKKLAPQLRQPFEKKLLEMIENPGDFLHPPRLIHKLLRRIDPLDSPVS